MSDWYKLEKGKVSYSVISFLMDEFAEFNDIFKKDKLFFKKEYKMSDEIINKIFNAKDLDISLDLKEMEKENIRLWIKNSKEYPRLLRNIAKPPLFLYVKGNMEIDEKTIGVVGTRKMTTYGKSATEKVTKELIDCGVTIVSGLALGVDATSHKKALQNNGKTIAVVGSGLDVIYPSENRKIWKKIEENGLLISEYPLGTPPNAWNFPRRNRIIVGLSRGVVVMESYKKGGSLITAKLAFSENRDLFAIPGFISYPSFEGCNELIKSNTAKLITKADDILEEFGWDKVDNNNNKINIELGKEESQIYKRLITEKNLDELIMETKMKGTELLIRLTEMEIKGYIKSIPGGRYRRNEI